MKERFNELERLLEKECKKYEDDCTACPYQKECNECIKLSQKIMEAERCHY